MVTTLIGILTVWGALALWYQLADHPGLRLEAVAVWPVFGCVMVVMAWSQHTFGRVLSRLTLWPCRSGGMQTMRNFDRRTDTDSPRAGRPAPMT